MLYKKIITSLFSLLMLLPFGANALSPDFYPSGSVLGSGRWVRISITEAGIHQITYDQLRQWGFSNPEAVTVFGYGSAANVRDIIDNKKGGDVPQQPVIYLDNKLVFYGEADARTKFIFNSSTGIPGPYIERNTASPNGYYFLTDSQPVFDTDANAIPLTAGTTDVDWHLCINYFEEELTNPNAAGSHYFGSNMGTDVYKITFPTPDMLLENATQQTIVYNPIFYSERTANRFYLTIPNGNDLEAGWSLSIDNPSGETATVPYLSKKNNTITRPLTTLIDSYTFTYRRNSSSTEQQFAALDQFSFYYHRRNNLSGLSELVLNYANLASNSNVKLANARPSTAVWNIEHAFCVRPFKTEFDESTSTLRFTTNTAYTLSATNDYGARFIAFNPEDTHPGVNFAGDMPNRNLHAAETPDLLIISSDLCYNQALQLAEIHRTRLGHSVLVVRQQEIFDEFSSGAPAVSAYRSLAKILYDRNPGKLRGILLFGAGSYDNRALMETTRPLYDAGALLLTYGTFDHALVGTTSRSFSTDAYFGMLSDSFTPAQMHRQLMTVNVGRIPASSVVEAADAISKIESYLSSVPTVDVNHRALLLCDSGNHNSHLNSSEKIAKELLGIDPGITAIKAYDDLYPWASKRNGAILRDYLIKSLQSGVGYFNYTGHGNPTSLSERCLWDISHVRSTSYSFFPLVMMASCDTYNFDRSTNNLGHVMTLQPNGGAIAYIGACRTVYELMNQVIDQNISHYYAYATESTTIGDVFRKGRNETIESTSDNGMCYNTLCYNLCGDPLLPLYSANSRISINAINGNPYSSTSKAPISALTSNTIDGYIFTSQGYIDTEFNGTIIATLYESPHTVSTLKQNGDESMDIVSDEDKLAEAVTRVENGRFSISITPPVQTREGDYNRLTFYAYNDKLSKFSKSYTKNLTMSFADEATPTNTQAPVISELYIDSPDFIDGDMVGSDFRLYATIEPDPSGINTAFSSIGTTTKVMIDEVRSIAINGTAMTTTADGTVTIVLDVNDMADGRHTLTLNTSDNIGNMASRSISFSTMNIGVTAILSVEESPARTQATFSLNHNFASEPSGRLVIENAAGEHVFSKNVTFPFEWDLTDENDNPVADGIYRARAILNAELQYATTPDAEIIVIQKQ